MHASTAHPICAKYVQYRRLHKASRVSSAIGQNKTNRARRAIQKGFRLSSGRIDLPPAKLQVEVGSTVVCTSQVTYSSVPGSGLSSPPRSETYRCRHLPRMIGIVVIETLGHRSASPSQIIACGRSRRAGSLLRPSRSAPTSHSPLCLPLIPLRHPSSPHPAARQSPKHSLFPRISEMHGGRAVVTP